MHETRPIHGQPMGELTIVCAIDGNLERIGLRQYDQLEGGAHVNRTAAVAFFAAPGAGLLMIADDCLLPWPNGQMEIDVGAGPQSRTVLQIDGETTKNIQGEKRLL